MDHFDAMRVFTRIVERRSFTQAADDLGLPRSSVIDADKGLEARLGLRLLQRTTRHVSCSLCRARVCDPIERSLSGLTDEIERKAWRKTAEKLQHVTETRADLEHVFLHSRDGKRGKLANVHALCGSEILLVEVASEQRGLGAGGSQFEHLDVGLFQLEAQSLSESVHAG